MNSRRVILLLASLLGLVVAGVLAWQTMRPEPAPPPAAIGGPFQLVDHNGRPADQSLLRGKWSVVFFGFTYCPDICPGTLHALGEATELLGPKGKDLQIVFVSVDPERDTPEQMKLYLDAQDLPNAIGLTGSPEQVADAAKAYRVFYRKEGAGEGYTVAHSTAAYLMDPRGRFVKPLAYGLTPDQMAEQIRSAM